MALRVVSGIILPTHGHRQAGTAVIHFHPHRVEGDVEPASPEDVGTAGPDGPFVERPCKMVALRRVSVRYTDRDSILGGEGRTYTEGWDLDDWFDDTGRESLTVRWDGGAASEVLEIAYQITGEVAGPAEG